MVCYLHLIREEDLEKMYKWSLSLFLLIPENPTEFSDSILNGNQRVRYVIKFHIDKMNKNEYNSINKYSERTHYKNSNYESR